MKSLPNASLASAKSKDKRAEVSKTYIDIINYYCTSAPIIIEY